MEIICDNCSTKLNVPDEKIPEGRQVKISCPKCSEKMILDPDKKEMNKSVSSEKTHGDLILKKSESTEAYEAEGATSFGFYHQEAKLVLVAENDPELAEKIEQAIEKMGYQSIPAENTNQAISKMRFHQFQLLILSETFDGLDLDQNPILTYLNHLSMSMRRKMFVALIGNSFNTMDQMMAFVMSANLVINKRDVDNLAGILTNAITDNDQFYKVFYDTLKETGRS